MLHPAATSTHALDAQGPVQCTAGFPSVMFPLRAQTLWTRNWTLLTGVSWRRRNRATLRHAKSTASCGTQRWTLSVINTWQSSVHCWRHLATSAVDMPMDRQTDRQTYSPQYCAPLPGAGHVITGGNGNVYGTGKGKGKVLPCSLPSVEPGADPGVQAVSPQVTWVIHPAVGCHYFPPGLRLPL